MPFIYDLRFARYRCAEKVRVRRGGVNKDLRSAALLRIRPSATIAVTKKAQALRAAGRNDIIALSSGEPDFITPDNIRAAAIEAIERGETKYPPVAGIGALKQAVQRKFLVDNNLEYELDQIIVSAGGKQVISNGMLATLNTGDEVVIAAPYWSSYPQLVLLCGGTPVYVTTRADQGYCLDPLALAAAITARTKWLVLNNPSNPTGAVYDEAALAGLASVLLDNPHVSILSDDMYEHLIYDGREFFTLAQVEPGLKERILTVNGVSKAYAMTGWRIGFAGGPAPLIKAMETLQGQLTHGASQISQWAAVEALNGPQTSVSTARATFSRRRALVVRCLNKIDGLSCPAPAGAFYVFVSCAAFIGCRTQGGLSIESDDDFCAALLDEAGVGVVPGVAFGMEPHFRLSYAASDDALSEACERIARFCAAVHR